MSGKTRKSSDHCTATLFDKWQWHSQKPDVTQSLCVSSEDDLLSNEIEAPSDFGGIESLVWLLNGLCYLDIL
jgi:hypothetical protein